MSISSYALPARTILLCLSAPAVAGAQTVRAEYSPVDVPQYESLDVGVEITAAAQTLYFRQPYLEFHIADAMGGWSAIQYDVRDRSGVAPDARAVPSGPFTGGMAASAMTAEIMTRVQLGDTRGSRHFESQVPISLPKACS